MSIHDGTSLHRAYRIEIKAKKICSASSALMIKPMTVLAMQPKLVGSVHKYFFIQLFCIKQIVGVPFLFHHVEIYSGVTFFTSSGESRLL